jgi:hypothetical protein
MRGMYDPNLFALWLESADGDSGATGVVDGVRAEDFKGVFMTPFDEGSDLI